MSSIEHKDLLSEFCRLVLIDDDAFSDTDLSDMHNYIDGLSVDIIKDLSGFHSDVVKNIAQNEVNEYIARYYDSDGLNEPFCFDSGDSFSEFQSSFNEYFFNKHKSNPPKAFNIIISIIKQNIEDYRQFSRFYRVNLSFLKYTWLKQVKTEAAESAVSQALRAQTEAQTAAETAKKAAENAAQKAAEGAKDSALKAEISAELAANRAEDAAKSAITNMEAQLSAKTAESSVTILGIFAGIVLTVVGGVIYSASALNNVSSSNIFKLVCVTALVGLVCIDIMAIMFYYISKIGKKSGRSILFNVTIIFVNVLLVLIMVLATDLYFKFPDNKLEESGVDTALSTDTNADFSLEDTILSTIEPVPADAQNSSETPEDSTSFHLHHN